MKLTLTAFLIFAPILIFAQNNTRDSVRQISADSLIFPSLNTEWGVAEFQKALKIIIGRQINDSLNISMTSEPSLFERITSYEKYWFLKSNNYSFNDRVSFNLDLTGLIKTILSNYYKKGITPNGKLLYDIEIIKFMTLLCNMTANQSDLADEFMKANPDLTKVQLEGFQKFTSGISIMVSSLLLTIEKEYNFYSNESICRISKALKDFYSKTNSKIAVDINKDFDIRIATIAKGHSLQCVREILK